MSEEDKFPELPITGYCIDPSTSVLLTERCAPSTLAALDWTITLTTRACVCVCVCVRVPANIMNTA